MKMTTIIRRCRAAACRQPSRLSRPPRDGWRRAPALQWLTLGLLFTPILRAERTEGFFNPPGSYAIEVSLENSPYLRLPLNRNAMTALHVAGDRVVGGTAAKAGRSPFLFLASLSERRLVHAFDVETAVPGQRAIAAGFGRAAGGALIAGTLPQPGAGASGHLLRVEIAGGELRVRDLGMPVAGEGVFAVTVDAQRNHAYGLAHPSGRFFDFDLASGRSVIHAETAPDTVELKAYVEFALKPEQYLSRQLVLDRQGRVYGSQAAGKLFRFDPAAGRIEILAARIPAIWDRGRIASVDAWTLAPDGSLYGGNAADGQLFRFDAASGAIRNLGKPIGMPRMKGLGFAANGKLYGLAGGAPGHAHLFTYDPREQSFEDLGQPNFTLVGEGLVPGITWRGYQLSALAVSEDGRTIVLGDDEILSQLMVFPVTN
jgi:hypothetical protein